LSNNKTAAWVTETFRQLLVQLAVNPAGVHLVRNSPYAQLNEDCDLLQFPYVPAGPLNESVIGMNTLCPDSRQTRGQHFRIHNAYARDHVETVKSSLQTLGVPAFIFSKHSRKGFHETPFRPKSVRTNFSRIMVKNCNPKTTDTNLSDNSW
jgi:hypothetical protein